MRFLLFFRGFFAIAFVLGIQSFSMAQFRIEPVDAIDSYGVLDCKKVAVFSSNKLGFQITESSFSMNLVKYVALGRHQIVLLDFGWIHGPRRRGEYRLKLDYYTLAGDSMVCNFSKTICLGAIPERKYLMDMEVIHGDKLMACLSIGSGLDKCVTMDFFPFSEKRVAEFEASLRSILSSRPKCKVPLIEYNPEEI